MVHRRLYRGLERTGLAALCARLRAEFPRLLIIVEKASEIASYAEDIRTWTGSNNVFELAPWDTLPLEPVSPSCAISLQRLQAAQALRQAHAAIVVSSPEGLMQKLLEARLRQASEEPFVLRSGLNISRDLVLSRLLDCGYHRSSLVEEPGDFAVRGSVVDFYPSVAPFAVRVEWQSEEVLSLRSFDPQTQRSLGSLAPLVEQGISPVREWLPLDAADPRWHERLRLRAQDLQVPLRELERIASALEHGEHFPEKELLSYLIGKTTPALPNTFEHDWCAVYFSEENIQRGAEHFEEHIQERSERAMQEGEEILPNPSDVYCSAQDLLESLRNITTQISIESTEILGEDSPDAPDAPNAHVQEHIFRSDSVRELKERMKGTSAGGKFSPLAHFIHRYRQDGYRVAILLGSESRARRLAERLLEFNLAAEILPNEQLSSWLTHHRTPLALLRGNILSSIALHHERVLVLAESDIYEERSSRGSRTRSPSAKKLLSSLAQLHPGDYLVHIQYGIGIYRGIRSYQNSSTPTDLIEIEYADSLLCVPVYNIAHIQKFSGPEGQVPRIDKLRSLRWTQVKQKVRKSLETLAGELIRLYAARSLVKGWRFEPMNSEDERFADEFPFDETPDQWQAIEDTLRDMASEKPMDRLVCGDVGFGKTEIALRAAYKCFQHRRQVAILAPTTILAEQHYQTFLQRFQDTPAQIGMVSRFQPPPKNTATLERLRSGELDIIIGTHRLLSRDVEFFDLGLLIIDEEHRFGVKQKERLKQMKKQVDVLTLTATPIPRTLHMSLLEIRDMSLIRTAPVDRRNVRTVVASVESNIIRDALLREFHRGGQSFVVHNRILGLENYTQQLAELLPELRFAHAHGQMPERQLEGIMHRFLNKELDCLVCTSIIESGIDIPSANTILIDRADRFGLAQLYQLRGRVGRSPLQAYCYFLVPKRAKMSAEASRRLHALESLDELGQGFELALRDLEIRGTGNLLGREQSGNVLALGFELYTRILKEAVAHLQERELPFDEYVEPELRVDIDACIPDWYMPDISEKLVWYQRLATLRNLDERGALEEELLDRYGPLPQEVLRYLDLMEFRCALAHIGVSKADIEHTRANLHLHRRAKVNATKILELVRQEPDTFDFGKNLLLRIQYPASIWERGPGFLFAYLLRQLHRCQDTEAMLAQGSSSG